MLQPRILLCNLSPLHFESQHGSSCKIVSSECVYTWLVRNLVMHSDGEANTWDCTQVLRAAKARGMYFRFLKVKHKMEGDKHAWWLEESRQTAGNLTKDLMIALDCFKRAENACN